MRPARLAAACVALCLSAGMLHAQDPDVFLLSLRTAGRDVTLGTPLNITARAGYDNQPSFSRDGRSVLYTSTRADQQADIYRYDIASRRSERVTRTAPESEYSAAQIPGTNDLAVIRVERDSTQRLWRVRVRGRRAEVRDVILPHVKPAGYFAYADSATIVLFVLGSPATLQVARVGTSSVDTVAVNVGRSLHRIPGTARVSFVSKAYDDKWWVMSLDPVAKDWSPLARLPEGVEDYAWLADGRLIAGQGSKLLVADPGADGVWKPVADLAQHGIGGITRLAVSAAGDRLAIVGVGTRQ